MNQTKEISVRHPYINEVPAELVQGFEVYRIDDEWQWVLVVDGKIMAQLLCVNAHGILLMLRITALKEAPEGWALILLRHVLKECKELNLLGYMTFLADDTKAQRRLMRIVQRAGGYLQPVTGVWAAGRFDIRY